MPGNRTGVKLTKLSKKQADYLGRAERRPMQAGALSVLSGFKSQITKGERETVRLFHFDAIVIAPKLGAFRQT